MTVSSKSYFNGLRFYLNTKHYEITQRDNGRIVLEEDIFLKGQTKPKKQKVRLGFEGDVIAFRLDKKNPKGNSDPLFHFLDDESKPWARRCDFVIFQLINDKLHVYCIEFKSSTLPESLVEQLNASEVWCRSLHTIIRLYTGKAKRMNLRKFVFSCMDDPSAFLENGHYIKRDHSIRHYHYDDLVGLMLDDLENENVAYIR